MKKIYVILVLLVVSVCSYGQPWMEKLEGQKSREKISFFDIQKEFNEYWNTYGVDKGYYYEDGIKKKASGWKQFKRWEYIWEPRANSEGYFLPNSHKIDEFNKFRSVSKSVDYGDWVEVGPITSPSNATGQPNGLGRLNAVVFHPSNASILYVASPSGGFWKTTTGGNAWTNLTEDLPTLGSSTAVINPDDPDEIYLGTGDRDAGDSDGLGIWKTTDGGTIWTRTLSEDITVGMMIMHPDNPDTIIAATSGGIYRTLNGGTSWTEEQTTGNYKDLEFHPTNPNIVYSTASGSFYKSTDMGDSWSEVSTSFSSSANRTVIGVTPAAPNYVYLMVTKSGANGLIGVFRSTDSGSTFTLMGDSPNLLGYETDGSDDNSQAWYDLCIAVDPLNANNVYTGGINIWKSTDGGATWNINTHWVGYGYPSVHADQHDLAFSPVDGKLYSGNDGGIHVTSNGGSTWTEISSGLGIAQIYKIGQSALTGDLVLNGYQDNGTSYCDGVDAFTTVIGGDGMECLIDYTNDNYKYGSLYFGDIRRSVNNSGYSRISSGISEYGAWVTPIKLDMHDPNTMYTGFYSIWKSENVKASSSGDVAWSKVSSHSSSNIIDLEQCVANPTIMYYSKSGSLYRIDNLNSSPSVTNLSSYLPIGGSPTDILTDPNDEDVVYITISTSVYKSEDKGQSWTNLTSNLPSTYMNCLVLDTSRNNESLYVGTYLGVYFKDESMSDWVSFNNGFPIVDVRELEIFYDDIDPANSKIKAATYGRGLWESPLNGVAKDLEVVKVDDVENEYCSAETIVPKIVIRSNGSEVITSATIKMTVDTDPPIVHAWTGSLSMAKTDTVVLDTLIFETGIHNIEIATINPNGSSDEVTSNDTLELEISYFNESDLPYNQVFDLGELPSCYSNVDNNGNDVVWEFDQTGDLNSSSSGNGYAILNPDNYTAGTAIDADLKSPLFDFTAYNAITLGFEHYFIQAAGSTAEVSYSTDGGTTWSSIQAFTTTTSDGAAFSQDITAEVAGETFVQFKWNFIGSTSDNNQWAIDSIYITGTSNNNAVVVTLDPSEVAYTTTQLNGLVNANNNTLTAIEFELGTSTGVYGQTIQGVPNTSDLNYNVGVFADLSGLNESTTYYYRLKAHDGSSTIYGSEKSFTTLYHSISLGTVSTGPYVISSAQGAAVQIPFTIVGEFESDNSFTAYLSNPTGDFTSENSIGLLSGGNAGTINATIAENTPSGTGYKIRVKSSMPQFISDTSDAIEIDLDDGAPSVTITSTLSGSTTVESIPVTITFSETVTGFLKNEIDITNGTMSTFDESGAPVYNITVVPQADGTVEVEVPAGVASDALGNTNTGDSWSITFAAVTDIHELLENGLRVYPNPTDGRITIESEQEIKNAVITITDLAGRIIFNKKYENVMNIPVDLGEQAPGVYLINITKDGSVIQAKLIVE